MTEFLIISDSDHFQGNKLKQIIAVKCLHNTETKRPTAVTADIDRLKMLRSAPTTGSVTLQRSVDAYLQ